MGGVIMFGRLVCRWWSHTPAFEHVGGNTLGLKDVTVVYILLTKISIT